MPVEKGHGSSICGPTCPSRSASWFSSLLARDPVHRPASAEEVALHLAAIVEGEDRGGMIDIGMNVPKSISDSELVPERQRFRRFRDAQAAPGDTGGSADGLGQLCENASESSDGVAVNDPTPVGMQKRKSAPTGVVNPIALTAIIGGVVLSVLLALIFVVRAFTH